MKRFCGMDDKDLVGSKCFCGADEQACGMTQAKPSIVDKMLLPGFLDDEYQRRPQLNRASDRLHTGDFGGLSLKLIFHDFAEHGKLERIRVVKNGVGAKTLPPGSNLQTMLGMLKTGYSFSMHTEYLTRPHSLSAATEALEDAMGLPVTARLAHITWFSRHRNAAAQRGGGEGLWLQSQGDQDLCAAAAAEHLIFKNSTVEQTVDLTNKGMTKDS
jgi:hypothetical protein